MKKVLVFAMCALLVGPAVALTQAKEPTKAKVTVTKEVDEKEDAGQVVPRHLQDISVTILSKSQGQGGEGSGVIMTRTLKDGDEVNFVWTAAHVVDNLRRSRSIIDSKTGTPKVVVEFDDAVVVKSLVEDGRTVGKIEFNAEVIRFSAEEDLALLRIRKKNFVDATVDFYLEDEIPPISTPLLHVGSLLGQLGSNSMTTGIMSQHGRLINKKVFDQTTVAAFPGSSGGGVYLEDGRMIGMVVRGAGETFNLIVPVRRLREWARAAKVEWAVDTNVAAPSEEDLKKLPVEDNGVEFSYSAKADAAAGERPGSPHSYGRGTTPYLGKFENQYPTLFRLGAGGIDEDSPPQP